MELGDYISVILGGLYAIVLISTTIFSIVGNIIQQKTMGMSPMSLIRYKIIMIFSPLYVLTLFVGVIVFNPSCYNNIYFVFFVSIYLIFLISYQSYFILEPFYDLSRFKQTVIKNQIRGFYKINSQVSNNIFEKKLIEELKKLREYKNEGSYFDIADVKDIWEKYLEFDMDKINALSVTFKKELVQVGFSIFEDDLININITASIAKYELVEMIISGKLDKYSRNLFVYVFNQLYDLYDYYKMNRCGFEEYNKLFVNFMESTFFDNKYMNLLLEILLDDKWNIKDVEYISLYFRNILIMFKNMDYREVISNELLGEKVNYFMACYKDNRKFNSKYGEEFDDFIKSCFVLISKEASND